MRSKIKGLLDKIQINCKENQLEQFITYYELLKEWNNKMNLTAITDEDEVIVKHFYDSITPASFYHFSNQRMIDIGAGAGFPSIPLKICFPDIQITLLDSLNKRITFLNHLISELKLDNIEAIHKRAEDMGKNPIYREGYDIVISRAVARLNILAELSLPLLKVNGTMISLKGSTIEDELNEAKHAIKILGGKIEEKYQIELPYEQGHRNIIMVKKVDHTPKKFPRNPGIPNKNPIV